MTWQDTLKMSDDFIEELNTYIRKADKMISDLYKMTETILDETADLEVESILHHNMKKTLGDAMEVMADLSTYRHELFDKNKALQEDLR